MGGPLTPLYGICLFFNYIKYLMSDYSLLLVLILDLIICNKENLPTVILYLQYSRYIVWFPTTCNDLTRVGILIDIQHHEEIINFKILQINPFPLKKPLTLKTRIDWNCQFINTWDAAEVSFSCETDQFFYIFYLVTTRIDYKCLLAVLRPMILGLDTWEKL